jgi:hypothetical protein
MQDTPHRRDFVRHVLLGSGIGLAAIPSISEADDPKPKDEPKAKEDPEKKASAPRTEAEARMDLVVARFGKMLDDEGRKAVMKELEGNVRRAERLRKFELTNGDEPYPVFVAYRAPLA